MNSGSGRRPAVYNRRKRTSIPTAGTSKAHVSADLCYLEWGLGWPGPGGEVTVALSGTGSPPPFYVSPVEPYSMAKGGFEQAQAGVCQVQLSIMQESEALISR